MVVCTCCGMWSHADLIALLVQVTSRRTQCRLQYVRKIEAERCREGKTAWSNAVRKAARTGTFAIPSAVSGGSHLKSYVSSENIASWRYIATLPWERLEGSLNLYRVNAACGKKRGITCGFGVSW